ncbi:MAG: prepilin peptidase [Sphingopyxis sp.]|uniref:A24 family peptidase n=1 Tax=Sphingopyxis sp. TaxID=1908224 RepID=UPI001A210C0E|nr:prepilin peptidase [Sphingopyxis sp.]MBJ7498779.1 prepilin peptidase [Sphingopyxis sp.]
MIAIKAIYVAILALAAYSDARRFTIPNLYPLFLLLLGGIAWFAGFPFVAPLWSHLLHFGIALGIGMLLFHFGWFGGGDVKLYAAVAWWFGLSNGWLLLLAVSLSGAVVVVLVVFLRLMSTLLDSADRTKGGFRTRRIAYGLAIATGGIGSLLWTYP